MTTITANCFCFFAFHFLCVPNGEVKNGFANTKQGNKKYLFFGSAADNETTLALIANTFAEAAKYKNIEKKNVG